MSSENSSISMPTEMNEDADQEILANGCDYLDDLHKYILQTAELFRTGDDRNGREHFVELIKGMEWFVTLVSTAELRVKLDFTGTRCEGQTVAGSVETLNQILTDILTAQEQRDLVLLSDLLEYELASQIELWLEIFTTLRNRAVDISGATLNS